METIKKLSEVDPRDIPAVERVFGQRIDAAKDALLILRTTDRPQADNGTAPSGEVPGWCNVLEGMSNEELAEFNAALAQPVRLARDGLTPN